MLEHGKSFAQCFSLESDCRRELPSNRLGHRAFTSFHFAGDLWQNSYMLGGFYIFILILAMMALFAFAFKLFSRMTRKPLKKQMRTGKAGAPGVCPVCGVVLEGGQKIRSAIFPGGDGRVCHIFGCPSCLSHDLPSARRTCPVCKRKLTKEEYLVARVFERQGRKSHVHILGCVHCRMG